MVMICPVQKFMFMGQPCNPEGTKPDPDMPDMPNLPPMPGMPTGHGGPNSPGAKPIPKRSGAHEDPVIDDRAANSRNEDIDNGSEAGEDEER